MSSSYITISYRNMFFYFIPSADLISIVQYCISYQWMICVYLSVRPSVYLSVCLSVWISLWFLFLFSFFSLFISFLFSHERLPHTHTHARTRTHTYIWIYVPSYDSYILLQKGVSEESYSSDSIMSYLI